MRVELTKEERRWIPISEMRIVRWIIEVMKDDDAIQDYAKIAIRLALRGAFDIDILRAKVRICRNDRIMNAYSDDSNIYDVWIETYALTDKGFVIVGACLTDIWSITGRYADDYKLLKYMIVRFFKEVRNE